MTRYGIPGYRTPREVLDAETQRILDIGVTGRAGMKVGVDVSLAELEQEFDAIYLALGAQNGSPLAVPGAARQRTASAASRSSTRSTGGWRRPPAMHSWWAAATPPWMSPRSRAGSATSERHAQEEANAEVLGHTAHDVVGNLRREGVKAVLTSCSRSSR